MRMKKILHLLHSEPDQALSELIGAISAGGVASVVCLYPDPVTLTPVDWPRVLDDIFAHDQIICWW